MKWLNSPELLGLQFCLHYRLLPVMEALEKNHFCKTGRLDRILCANWGGGGQMNWWNLETVPCAIQNDFCLHKKSALFLLKRAI